MLKIEHLTKAFGDKLAVDDLSLHIAPGEIYGFIGHNGAGKTTTLRSVAGIQQFDKGEIFIAGHSVRTEPLECKRALAYIPDNPDLYDFMSGIKYLNEFISRVEVHERDQKRARYAIQHISIYFNYIGKFENEVTQLAEPTEQEIRQMWEEIEEAKKEKSRAYHRNYSREYRAKNLEKQREYDRMKAREYRARRKAQAAAAQPTQ